jgi:predicted amidophosphoribosyltransferase
VKIYHSQFVNGVVCDVVLASEALAIISKLKCCGNCRHNFDADEEMCEGCCEPNLKKWEMRE